MSPKDKSLECEVLTPVSRREFLDASSRSAAAAALLGASGPVASLAAERPAIRLNREGSDIRFTAGTTLVCRIPATAIGASTDTGASAHFSEMGSDRARRTFQAGPWDVDEQIRLVSQDLYEWRRTWKNRSRTPVQADLCMEIETGYAPEFTLVPGISYNGNPEYGRSAVKGLAREGVPWIFSAFRSNIPAGHYSEGAGWSIFVFTSTQRPSLFCGFSLAPKNNRLTHRLLWPERDDLPDRRTDTPGIRENLEIAPGAAFEATAYVVVRAASEKRRAFSTGMDHAWRLNRHTIKPSFAPKRVWELGTQFARETLWYDQPDFTGFNIGCHLVNGKWEQSKIQRFEIGWCGQNGAYASALLQDYIWNKNAESLAKGQRTLDFWAQNGRLQCGLFYTHFDVKLGAESHWGPHNVTFLGRPLKPGERYVDTLNLGHGAYQFCCLGTGREVWLAQAVMAAGGTGHLQFFPGASAAGRHLREGLVAPRRVPGSRVHHRRGDAVDHGQGLPDDARPPLSGIRAPGLPRLCGTRPRSRMTCTGGALDADTIDRKAGVALLFGALDLYDVAGSKEYLRDAELAGYYMASWQWHY